MDPNSYTVELQRLARRKSRERRLVHRTLMRSITVDIKPRLVEDFERQWVLEQALRSTG